MEVELFANPKAYFDTLLPHVQGREAACAMFMSIVQAEVRAYTAVPPEHFLLAVVHDGRHIAFALSTRAKSLLMFPWNEECAQLAEPICSAIASFIEGHPQYAMEVVMGTTEQAHQMTNAILALPSFEGRTIQQTDRMVGYQLTPAALVMRDELDTLEATHFRLATETDAQQLGGLLHQFYEDCGQSLELGKRDEAYVQEAQRFIQKQFAHVWCSSDNGGEILALAVIGEPTQLGYRINRVFSARHARRLGYARLLVTAVCRRLFQKAECTEVLLMADGAKEAPNRCYQSIGFRQHDCFAEITF